MRICLLAAMLLVCSCHHEEVVYVPPEDNAKPLADAGTGDTFLVGTTITLDGSNSFDPDGAIVRYWWRVVALPAGGTAQIEDTFAETTTFTLDQPGTYTFSLRVTDDDGDTDDSEVTFTARAPVITVDAGVDQSVAWSETVQLAGAYDSEIDASATWEIVSKPPGSVAALSDETSLTPSFVADREGNYVVRLTAATPYSSASDDVAITAIVARQSLDYVLVDAEYSTALDRFVIVSDVPARLRLLDAATGTEDVLDLPESPVAISLAPGGLRAAVAYDSKVAIIDLQTRTITATHVVPINIHDLVFDGADHVHCFHRAFNNVAIYSVDLGTGDVVASSLVYGFADARLHPSGQIVYAGSTHVSPTDLIRYDPSGATIAYTRDSPYHGDYAMGGGLWFTEDGSAIIMRSGNIFRSSNDPTLDMTYIGSLGEGDYGWVTHSQSANRFAAVRTEYDAWFNPKESYLRVYDGQYTLLRATLLPDTPYNGMMYRSFGRFVAFSANLSKLYVIARAGTNTSNPNALYTFDP